MLPGCMFSVCMYEFFSIVKCVLLVFFRETGEQIKLVNAVVVSYSNDYIDLFVRVYFSFTS